MTRAVLYYNQTMHCCYTLSLCSSRRSCLSSVLWRLTDCVDQATETLNLGQSRVFWAWVDWWSFSALSDNLKRIVVSRCYWLSAFSYPFVKFIHLSKIPKTNTVCESSVFFFSLSLKKRFSWFCCCVHLRLNVIIFLSLFCLVFFFLLSHPVMNWNKLLLLNLRLHFM